MTVLSYGRYRQLGGRFSATVSAVTLSPGADKSALWLFSPPVRTAPPDSSELGEVLKAYRIRYELSQSELADLLHCDQSYLSLLENRKRFVRDVGELRRFAAVLGLPEAELGLADGQPAGTLPADDTTSTPREVLADQRAWRSQRRLLNAHRFELGQYAATLYPDARRVGDTPLLTRKDWLSPEPVDLDAITLLWRSDAAPPLVTGVEPESAAVRPRSVRGGRHHRYSEAIRLVDRPALFVNRRSFRLLDVAWADGRGRMEFGYTSYFEMVDLCEAVAHELAAAGTDPTMDRLPFRSLIGDPFDLTRRPLLPSIDTLTLRRARDGSARFVLHRREATNVALAGGLLHVMPAGVFQPSTVLPWDQANDFDLWRNMMREFAEEFLGDPEADGDSGEPIDYFDTEPYRTLNQARWERSVRTWCFGLGLDPLTLAGEILAVVVFDADVYDQVFAGMVGRNSEGTLTGTDPDRPEAGIAFTSDNVSRLLADERLAPAAAACLHLAWHHRNLLLG